MNGAGTRIRVCGAGEVPAGEARRVETAGLTLAVFNVEGRIYVTDDACTHGPGSLSQGFIDGDCVECDFHQGVFNIRTGEVVTPPPMVPIRTYPVFVDGDGTVYIELDAPAGPEVKS